MGRMRALPRGYCALLVVWAAVASISGCSDPRCPRGYDLRGDTCYRIKDAGSDANDPQGNGREDATSPVVTPDADQPTSDSGDESMVDAGEEPMGCDQGSELDDTGTCVDIDECADGLDDCDEAPSACVNREGGLGFSCACPTGYRGDGRGTDGCVDIDECTEQTHACDALAACNNSPGSYSCGDCPAGYTPGSGGACVDLDECRSNNGGCDMSPAAECLNQVGTANTCRCPAGYTGNGVGGQGCIDEDECVVNNGGCDTNPMATCSNRTGAPRTCTCPSGSSGTGIGANGCVDTPDCTSSSCLHGGRCIEGVGSVTCDCTGTGYGGATCQVDPCSPDPCGAGLTCTRTSSGTASCAAACTSSDIGCQPGDVCAADAECKTGGDTSATCDPSAKVCVRVCPSMTIVSQASLDAAKYCKEIDGDLKLEPNFATIGATGLPHLTRVRGSIVALGGISGLLPVTSIVIPNLQTVDGTANFALLPQLATLNLPRLRTAGNLSVTTNGKLTHLSLPQLSTVTGDLGFTINITLERVDIERLTMVGGRVSLRGLCRLPWTQVQRISTLGATQDILEVGCCNMSTDKFACGGTQCRCN
jgi:hypothetical protein